ncbi:MAG: hypothetical protein ACI88C_003140, partial [Acidimicrobiales bacterium]
RWADGSANAYLTHEVSQLGKFLFGVPGEILVSQDLDGAVAHRHVRLGVVIIAAAGVLDAVVVFLIDRNGGRRGHLLGFVELGTNPIPTKDPVIGHEVFAVSDQGCAPTPVTLRAIHAVHRSQGSDIQQRGADRHLDAGVAQGLYEACSQDWELGPIYKSTFGQWRPLALEALLGEDPVGLIIHRFRRRWLSRQPDQGRGRVPAVDLLDTSGQCPSWRWPTRR